MIACALGLVFGLLGVRVTAHISGATAAPATTWLTLLAIIAAGLALVAAATAPLARTRLTPDLLRRE